MEIIYLKNLDLPKERKSVCQRRNRGKYFIILYSCKRRLFVQSNKGTRYWVTTAYQ